ncbi:MAG: glycosyltransferase [Candidatus Omnitrophica bacterium]|nr:glycosyltransferase [Candidatus Omnitrophota bacterium]
MNSQSPSILIAKRPDYDLGQLKSRPLVTVIIPFYNARGIIGRAIESIKKQTYSEYEIIAVDDGSTDSGMEYLSRSYPEVRLFSLKSNRGTSVAKNLGVINSRGSLLAFLDSDDTWDENYLSYQVTVLSCMPSCGLSFSDCLLISQDTRKKIIFKSDIVKNDPIRFLLLNLSFIRTLSTVVIRKTLFEDFGLFNERLRLTEDRDLYIRLLEAKVKFCYLPIIIVDKFQRQESLMSDSLAHLNAAVKLLILYLKKSKSLQYKRYALIGLDRRIREVLAQDSLSFMSRFSFFVMLMYYRMKYQVLGIGVK